MNFASIVMYSNKITKAILITTYLSGIPYDTVNALSTTFFVFLSTPMIEKLDRIRLKYGMIR